MPRNLLENVVDGLSSIITKPVKGAKKGIKGLVKDALAEPKCISENIKTCMHGVELGRVQYPRCRLDTISSFTKHSSCLTCTKTGRYHQLIHTITGTKR